MSPLHWKMSHLYKGCATIQPCQCGLLVTDCHTGVCVTPAEGHETTAQTSLNLNILDTKSKAIYGFLDV